MARKLAKAKQALAAKRKFRFRSSVTGKFVSAKYAARNEGLVVREKLR